MRSSRIPIITTAAVLAFFYLPIGALVLKSFNASRYSPEWSGFTLKWYGRLFQREDLLAAFVNSLKVALTAAAASMILGTCAAFALHRYKSRLQGAHSVMIHVPLVLPDILMGMSLLLLFISAGISLSLATVTIAHITFCLSYVALVVLARLQNFDPSIVEAARDLGASRLQSFLKISLPMLFPGILAGGLLAFTLSIDDYVVTFFVKGPGSDTLPTLVYSMIKKSKELPVINALSTLMLIFTFLIVIASQRFVRPVKP